MGPLHPVTGAFTTSLSTEGDIVSACHRGDQSMAVPSSLCEAVAVAQKTAAVAVKAQAPFRLSIGLMRAHIHHLASDVHQSRGFTVTRRRPAPTAPTPPPQNPSCDYDANYQHDSSSPCDRHAKSAIAGSSTRPAGIWVHRAQAGCRVII